MLVHTHQKNIAQAFILERYFLFSFVRLHFPVLASVAVFVLVFDKHLVVCLVACDICIFLDDATECLVEILEDIFCLAEQTECRSLIHV